MTDLTKLRDQLAVKYSPRVPNEETDFCAGFDAAIQALSEAAGEFDISHARFELDKREERVGPEMLEDDPDRFLEGARWQFEADRARIGLAEMSGVSKELFEMVCDERDQFEARLAFSENCLQDSHVERDREFKRYQDKLSSAEARCKELEAYIRSQSGMHKEPK